jgi:surface protein
VFNYTLGENCQINLDCPTRKKYGEIGTWCVSRITDMSNLFAEKTTFNSDISRWDVSNVRNMEGMFIKSAFNVDISGWNVSKVENMNLMFSQATLFNQNLCSWGPKLLVDPTFFYANFVSNMFTGSFCFNVSSPVDAQGPWCANCTP